MANARLPDVDTIRAMGMNPAQVDKLLAYMAKNKGPSFDNVDAIRKVLRKNDRQDFIKRFQWHNLPNDLDGEFIERVLYYRYSGIFFYIPELETFNFLPWVGQGGIDEKGRWKQCKPLPFCGASEKKSDEERAEEVYIPGLVLTPVYDITKTEPRVVTSYNGEQSFINPMADNCVILNSYCKDLSQKSIPEQALVDPILNLMAEAPSLARTNLYANAGTKGMRVANQDEYSNVVAANDAIQRAALSGERFIPVVGMTEFQEFSDGNSPSGDGFFMYMQILDNLRLQTYGIKNNGIFEKSQYINDTMAGNIQANVGQRFQDALEQRQKFCDFVNAIWGLGIWCSASETITNTDTNGDGEILDEPDGESIAPDEAINQGVENE